MDNFTQANAVTSALTSSWSFDWVNSKTAWRLDQCSKPYTSRVFRTLSGNPPWQCWLCQFENTWSRQRGLIRFQFCVNRRTHAQLVGVDVSVRVVYSQTNWTVFCKQTANAKNTKIADSHYFWNWPNQNINSVASENSVSPQKQKFLV